MKKFWKKAIIGSSIFTSILATGLSTGLVSHSNKSENQTVSNAIDYHEEINKNTEQVKQTIQKTPRSDLLEMLDSFSNNNSEKSSLKLATATVQTKDEKHNEQYEINNLSTAEKNKIVDLVFQIGSGTILINDLVKKAEENSHNDLNQLISKSIINSNSNNNKQNLDSKTTKKYFLNSKSSEVSNDYSNEDLEALAAFIDPNYLNHLRERSNYLVSYATILSVATAAAWGIAAYYWASWWMFGANIPFAIAATVQAGLMTADMGIAWADYGFNESAIRNISNFHKDPLYEYLVSLIKRIIEYLKIGARSYLKKILNERKLDLKNIFFKIKNFIRNFKNKIREIIRGKTSIKLGISATSWAAPIGITVVKIISNILNISNKIVNFSWALIFRYGHPS